MRIMCTDDTVFHGIPTRFDLVKWKGDFVFFFKDDPRRIKTGSAVNRITVRRIFPGLTTAAETRDIIDNIGDDDDDNINNIITTRR